MSRRTLRLLPLAVLLAAATGCGTIYSDVYAPKRNHFVPPVSRPSIPIIPAPPAPGDTNPLNPGGSSAPTLHPPAQVVVPPAGGAMAPEGLPGQ